MRLPRSVATRRTIPRGLTRRYRFLRPAHYGRAAEVRPRIAARAVGGFTMSRWTLVVALGITAVLTAGAQRVDRPVVPGGPGPNRLALDATALARVQPFHVADVAAAEGRAAVATGGAGDLRLFDASNKEVPYLLITPQVEAQWRGSRLLRVAPAKLSSGFEAD